MSLSGYCYGISELIMCGVMSPHIRLSNDRRFSINVKTMSFAIFVWYEDWPAITSINIYSPYRIDQTLEHVYVTPWMNIKCRVFMSFNEHLNRLSEVGANMHMRYMHIVAFGIHKSFMTRMMDNGTSRIHIESTQIRIIKICNNKHTHTIFPS